jgi:magnesium chelatase subunit I
LPARFRSDCSTSCRKGTSRLRATRFVIPDFIKQIVEGIAFKARADQRIDKRSGVSQRLPISCLENVASNAERRAILTGESGAVARVADVYAALPAITGKIELEYEGELKGGETVARDLIRQSIQAVFRQSHPTADFKPVIDFFESGGSVKLADTDSATAVLSQLERIPELLSRFGNVPESQSASFAEFVLEGLCATDKIGRSEERGFIAAERKAAAQDLYRDYSMERSRYKKPLN